VEMERGAAGRHETHNHGIQVTTYVPSEWSGVDPTFLIVILSAPCAGVRQKLQCAAPRIPHGPREPDPPAPDAAPYARLHPNHRGPSRPVTPVTLHTTYDKRGDSTSSTRRPPYTVSPDTTLTHGNLCAMVPYY